MTLLELLFPKPKVVRQWRTLRLYAHTLNALGTQARSNGQTVPQHLDRLMNYIAELENEILNLKRECKGDTA